ncbi:uncharacterized protein LOC127738644 isoform X2 [Mytilus californianus]|uniref:uncharacterized protein LOC127738644 isoform X2 n=1 Tax=Mytilus californianus TaxID=6549 RepID=UPI002245321B|nr:uncharacterized protein LOC127738644 isoform X2 [Mytilus californianus]
MAIFRLSRKIILILVLILLWYLQKILCSSYDIYSLTVHVQCDRISIIDGYPGKLHRVIKGYNSMDSTLQSKLHGKPIEVKPLSDDEADRLGTRLLGETLVYGISAGLLLYEYNRSSRNDQIKEEKRKFEIATLQRKIHDYGIVTEQQATEIKELRRQMFQLEDNNTSLASKLFSFLKSG